jgi:hypothetical protein
MQLTEDPVILVVSKTLDHLLILAGPWSDNINGRILLQHNAC